MTAATTGFFVCHVQQLGKGTAAFLKRFIDEDDQAVWVRRRGAMNKCIDLIWRAVFVKDPRAEWKVQLLTSTFPFRLFLIFVDSVAIMRLLRVANFIEVLGVPSRVVFTHRVVVPDRCTLGRRCSSRARDS